MEKYFEKEENKSLGFRIGTISLSHKLLCRIFILCLCGLFSFVLVSVFVSIRGGDFEILDFRTLKQTFTNRRQHLKRVCRKYSNPLRPEHGITVTDLIPSRFQIFKKPSFAICVMPKIASTSFGQFFRLVAERSKEGKKNLIYNELSTTSKEIGQSYKTLIVRHPLERILSVYLYFFHKVMEKDLAESILRVLEADPPSRDKTPPGASGLNGPEKESEILSFEQFVTFLINGSRSSKMDELLSRKFHLNQHWIPYWKLCSPCHSDAMPNTIIKMDEGYFQQELEYAFQESGLNDVITHSQVEVPHLNPTKGDHVTRAKKYYGQLTKNLLKELHFKYRIDFELFDYALEPYLSYAKD